LSEFFSHKLWLDKSLAQTKYSIVYPQRDCILIKSLLLENTELSSYLVIHIHTVYSTNSNYTNLKCVLNKHGIHMYSGLKCWIILNTSTIPTNLMWCTCKVLYAQQTYYVLLCCMNKLMHSTLSYLTVNSKYITIN